MTQEPNFVHDVKASGPGVLRCFWNTLAILTVALAVYLIAQFDPPVHDAEHPLVVHPFAVFPATCGDWPDVIGPASPRHVLHVDYRPCREFDPRGNLRNYLAPGEVAAILDTQVGNPGRSTEYTDGRFRYFKIEINLLTFNHRTWLHEIGGHVLHGHTAVRVPGFLAAPTNGLLEHLVDPYLVFGDQWRGITLAIFSALFAAGITIWRQIRASTCQLEYRSQTS